MFFSKKNKPVIQDSNEKSYQIPYSKGFKGFKWFPIVVHGDKESEENNEKMFNSDFSTSAFIFKCFDDSSKNRTAILYINNGKMGAIFEPTQIHAIENGMIEKIHIEPKEENIVGSSGTETRHRISVFVKYKAELLKVREV